MLATRPAAISTVSAATCSLRRKRDVERVAVRGDVFDRTAELHVDVQLAKEFLDARRDLAVHDRCQALAAIDDRDLGSQRPADRRELDTDRAAADDDDRLRRAALAIQDRIGIEDSG